jgi:hypothetical protein
MKAREKIAIYVPGFRSGWRDEMEKDRDGVNLARLSVAAGVLAVAVVGVALLVPRRRLAMLGEPFRMAAQSPLASAVTLWFAGLINAAAPNPPVFNDLRPFDEF